MNDYIYFILQRNQNLKSADVSYEGMKNIKLISLRYEIKVFLNSDIEEKLVEVTILWK